MNYIPKDYIERTYAGWLGKLIGVRYGAPTEGMSFEKLREYYGELDGYLVDFKDFAADDDTNGPMFFLRALEDSGKGRDITAEEMSMAWLNYPPYEHGFYWWGGYGNSTEHTAYLNLQSGIMAPRSGSVEQNGKTVAEQIGGQIFIDTWGLVAPNNIKLAADLAEKMASVSHGGNGVYGGMFIAAAISAAYTEKDIVKVIDKALSTIPEDCDYAVVTRDIMDFYYENPEDWEKCFWHIRENYWQDKFGGACHIIPNSAIMIMSLMYGEGEFDKTLNICHMGGWDTDCTVGNIGAVMGVFVGLDGIDYDKWRKPINDFFVASSTIGSLNIMDAPACVSYIAKQAYKLAGKEAPEKWKDFVNHEGILLDFELPGSTHGLRARGDLSETTYFFPDKNEEDKRLERQILINTDEKAKSGSRSLKVLFNSRSLGKGTDRLRIYLKTYYHPADFHDDRYGPCFSPIFYPGMTVETSVMIQEIKYPGKLMMYAIDGISGREYTGEAFDVQAGKWQTLKYKIPSMEGRIEEVGIVFIGEFAVMEATAYIDDFKIYGNPDYSIDFEKEQIEKYTLMHNDVGQFTSWKGLWGLEDGQLTGVSHDSGEIYTGLYDAKDYTFTATLIPKTGTEHRLLTRVQGAIRSYAVGLSKDNKLVIEKNDNGYKTLAYCDYDWSCGNEYTISVKCIGAKIEVYDKQGKLLVECEDVQNPWLSGCIGAGIRNGSRCHFADFVITN